LTKMGIVPPQGYNYSSKSIYINKCHVKSHFTTS
jgi:hypothetical protein